MEEHPHSRPIIEEIKAIQNHEKGLPAEGAEEEKPLVVESIATPADIRSVALTGLFLFALMYTLYFARPVLLPITVAVLLNFLLRPIIMKLEKWHIRPAISAAVVMILFFGMLGGIGYSLSKPAQAWAARTPAMMTEVGTKLRKLRQPVERVTKAAEQVGKLAQGAGAAGAEKPPVVQVQHSMLDSALVSGTQAVIGQAVIVIILLYFMLASGDLFLRKMIRVLPTLSDKKKGLRIATEMQHEISHYFLVVTVINVGLGAALSAGLWAVGLPNPVLWGALGGLLNFIPYLGATVNITLTTFVALLSFDSLGQVALVPLVYIAINSIEGSIVTPIVMGQRFTLNTVVIFIWLIFWGWMWGVIGALIAVPMLAAFKIFCDHIEGMDTVGEFLGN